MISRPEAQATKSMRHTVVIDANRTSSKADASGAMTLVVSWRCCFQRRIRFNASQLAACGQNTQRGVTNSLAILLLLDRSITGVLIRQFQHLRLFQRIQTGQLLIQQRIKIGLRINTGIHQLDRAPDNIVRRVFNHVRHQGRCRRPEFRLTQQLLMFQLTNGIYRNGGKIEMASSIGTFTGGINKGQYAVGAIFVKEVVIEFRALHFPDMTHKLVDFVALQV